MRRLLLILILLLFAAPAFAQQPTATPTPTNPTRDPCGLPKQGAIKAAVTFTLKVNCTQIGYLDIRTSETPSVALTINSAGHTIYGGPSSAILGLSFLIVDDQGENAPTTTIPVSPPALMPRSPSKTSLSIIRCIISPDLYTDTRCP